MKKLRIHGVSFYSGIVTRRETKEQWAEYAKAVSLFPAHVEDEAIEQSWAEAHEIKPLASKGRKKK